MGVSNSVLVLNPVLKRSWIFPNAPVPLPSPWKDVTVLARRPQEEEVGHGSRVVPLRSPAKPSLEKSPSWPTNAHVLQLIFRHANNYISLRSYDCYTFLLWGYQTMHLIPPITEVLWGPGVDGNIICFLSVIHLLFKHLPLPIPLISMFQILVTSLTVFHPPNLWSLFSFYLLHSFTVALDDYSNVGEMRWIRV